MPLKFTTTVSGSPDEKDKRAAVYAIDQHNAAHPDDTPLGKGSNAQIDTSLTAIMSAASLAIHQHNLAMADRAIVEDYKARLEIATDAERQASLALLPAKPVKAKD